MEITNKFKAHQGDVQIYSINEMPKNVNKIDKTFFASSERSGHAHALTGDYELFELDNEHIINVGKDGAILNHTQMKNLTKEYWDKNKVTPIADHKPTFLKEGIYYVGIQRKADPFMKTWERVID